MSMHNFSANSDYMVVSTNEVSSIISRFSPDMISDIIEEAIANKYRSYSPRLVNLVESLEQNYKTDMAALPDYVNEIRNNREELYKFILSTIGPKHQIWFKTPFSEIQDFYSAAYIVYDFLISNFTINVTNFFTNYIYKEKSTIYEALNLSSKKKEVSPYSKKLFSNNGDNKLALIHANLEFVLENICTYDISLETFISITYIDNKVLANALINLIGDNGDFFRRYIIPYYQQYAGIISTNIKFALQEQSQIDITNIV